MKFSAISCVLISSLIGSSFVFAGEYPEGQISIHNGTNKNITAQVSGFVGKFQLNANAERTVSYSALAQVCSPNPTQCTAYFYVDNTPVGTAVINVKTGKLMKMKLPIMNVHTTKEQQVLRSVDIT